ncbi:MAG: DUF4129 domain-containing protein [Methanobacteriota archaeon]
MKCEGEDPHRVYSIEGRVPFTYTDELREKTNPYLADSDGDGMSDAYEVTRTAVARLTGRSGGLNPTRGDGASDPDNDTRPSASEAARGGGGPHGTDALAEDSDLGCLSDGEEHLLGLDPLAPKDDLLGLSPANDRDGDLVPDIRELTQWAPPGLDGRLVSTDFASPDTDRDGLLDGNHVSLAAGHPNVSLWRSLGILYRSEPGRVEFLGEIDSDPTDADSSDDGVPDGWAVANRVSARATTSLASRYEHGRPAWWDEASHGVFWWGLGRHMSVENPPTDLDGDGLHDANGEDPIPTLSHNNTVWRGDPRDASVPDVERLVRAQAYGYPPDARDEGLPCAEAPRQIRCVDSDSPPDGVADADDRVPTRVVIDRIQGAAVSATPIPISKGAAFQVEGRVLALEAGGVETPVANATVLAFVNRPDNVFGAGFSDAAGRFVLDANVTRSLSADIPPQASRNPGFVLFGATEGRVSWTSDPLGITPGNTTAGSPNVLGLRVQNTTPFATPGDSSYGTWRAERPRAVGGGAALVTTHAIQGSVSALVPITVRSGTAADTDLPGAVVNGGRLDGRVRLLDDSGAALPGKRVRFGIEGEPLSNVTTDANGTVPVNRSIERPAPATIRLVVGFDGEGFLSGSTTRFPLVVRNTTSLLVTSVAPTPAVAGGTVTVRGRLLDRGLPLSGGRVELASDAAVNATTGLDGVFSLAVPVPSTQAPGRFGIGVLSRETARHAGSDAEGEAQVLGLARILDLPEGNLPRSEVVNLTGTLVDARGAPLAGRVVRLLWNDAEVARATTNAFGSFRSPFRVPANPLGESRFTARFDGDGRYVETFASTRLLVAAGTRLELPAGLAVRGEPIVVRGVLRDDLGSPVPGQTVEVTAFGRTTAAVTDSAGRFAATTPPETSASPGFTDVRARFNGTADRKLLGAAARALYDVRLPVDVVATNGSLRRGDGTLVGTLLSREGSPLVGESVRFAVGADAGTAPVAETGRFLAPYHLARDAPLARVPVRFDYAGRAPFAPATAALSLPIVSTTTLDLSLPAELVRGGRMTLEGRVLQDNGRGVPNGTVQVFLGEVLLGFGAAGDGVASVAFDVPAGTRPGPARLVLRFVGTEFLEAAEVSREVSVLVGTRLATDLPTVARPDSLVSGTVRVLDDGGRPLAGANVAIDIDGRATPFLVTTDEDGRAEVAIGVGEGDVAFTIRYAGAGELAPASDRFVLSARAPAFLETPVGRITAVGPAIAVLLAAAAAYAYIRRRRMSEAERILADAEAALVAGSEYVAVILNAYRRLEELLGERGLAGREALTAREFELRAREALTISEANLARLIDLFERARYSCHAVGRREQDEAVEALLAVRRDLRQGLGGRDA